MKFRHGAGHFIGTGAGVNRERRSHERIGDIVSPWKGGAGGKMHLTHLKCHLFLSLGEERHVVYMVGYRLSVFEDGKALNHRTRSGFRPSQVGGQEERVGDLFAKLREGFSECLGRAVNVEVVRFEVGDGGTGWLEVMEAPVKFIGFDYVPCCAIAAQVIGSGAAVNATQRRGTPSPAFIVAASQLEVVVLPWVPATARVGFPRVIAPNRAARLTGVMPASAKWTSKGVLGNGGVQTTVSSSFVPFAHGGKSSGRGECVTCMPSF